MESHFCRLSFIYLFWYLTECFPWIVWCARWAKTLCSIEGEKNKERNKIKLYSSCPQCADVLPEIYLILEILKEKDDSHLCSWRGNCSAHCNLTESIPTLSLHPSLTSRATASAVLSMECDRSSWQLAPKWAVSRC